MALQGKRQTNFTAAEIKTFVMKAETRKDTFQQCVLGSDCGVSGFWLVADMCKTDAVGRLDVMHE